MIWFFYFKMMLVTVFIQRNEMINYMNYYIPDNNDTYEWYERERDRIIKLHRKQEIESLDIDELPFFINSSYQEEYDD